MIIHRGRFETCPYQPNIPYILSIHVNSHTSKFLAALGMTWGFVGMTIVGAFRETPLRDILQSFPSFQSRFR